MSQTDRRRLDLIVAAMTLLQVGWLVALRLTGSATGLKIPVLILYTLLAGGLTIALARAGAQSVMRWTGHLRENPRPWLAALCAGVVGVGILYALEQRLWPYDEEGAYLAARVIAVDGLPEFFARYNELPWLGAQHPPLIILINGFVMALVGLDLLVPRLVTLPFMLGTVILTYLVGRRLYDATTGLLAAIAIVTFPLFLRLGTVVMIDMQVTFFAALTIYLLLILRERPSYRLALGAGIAVGLGLLSKYTMFLMAPVVATYFLIHRSFLRALPRLGVIGVVAAAVLLTWVGYAFSIGIFEGQQERLAYLATVMARDVSIESEPESVSDEESEGGGGTRLELDYGAKLALETALTRLPSALGVYNAPLLLLGLVTLWRDRKRSDLFIALWIAIVWIALFLTLPDHRYFMLTFPALALVIARGLAPRPALTVPLLFLAMANAAGAWYLFVDWQRGALLFLQ